jgi:hypothetical protein
MKAKQIVILTPNVGLENQPKKTEQEQTEESGEDDKSAKN